jgi:hypothetical protein
MDSNKIKNEKGSIGAGVLLWLLGVPLPVILLISMLRSC